MNSIPEQATPSAVPTQEWELDLKKRGIQYTIETVKEDNGTLKRGDRVAKITAIPALERAAIGVFSGVDDPPEGDCAKIYEEFKKEVDAEGGTEGCTGCKRGAIIRKYLPRMKTALQGTTLLERYEQEEDRRLKNERFIKEQEEKNHLSDKSAESRTSQAKDNDIANPVQVSGSGAESTSRNVQRPSLLRRAAIRLKKIYRACTEP